MDTASEQYLYSAVMTAPPEQLHLMLYDGAIRFTRRGIDGIQRKDWEAAYLGFTKAQKIILEMLNSLNYNVNRDLCTRMASLYNFLYQKLVEASIRKDIVMAEDALKILTYQRDSWVLVIEKLKEERAAGTTTQTPAKPEPTYSDAGYGSLSVQG